MPCSEWPGYKECEFNTTDNASKQPVDLLVMLFLQRYCHQHAVNCNELSPLNKLRLALVLWVKYINKMYTADRTLYITLPIYRSDEFWSWPNIRASEYSPLTLTDCTLQVVGQFQKKNDNMACHRFYWTHQRIDWLWNYNWNTGNRFLDQIMHAAFCSYCIAATMICSKAANAELHY